MSTFGLKLFSYITNFLKGIMILLYAWRQEIFDIFIFFVRVLSLIIELNITNHIRNPNYRAICFHHFRQLSNKRYRKLHNFSTFLDSTHRHDGIKFTGNKSRQLSSLPYHNHLLKVLNIYLTHNLYNIWKKSSIQTWRRSTSEISSPSSSSLSSAWNIS